MQAPQAVDRSPVKLDEASIARVFRAPPERRLDVGHSRLAYYRFGQGPDVVFIHGWPVHSATYRRILPKLAESFTCHLVDLPGTGQTIAEENAPIDIHSHAKTMRAAIDQLGLTRYALLAHDSGGFIARLVAVDDPRVAGIVLGSTEVPKHAPWLVMMYAAMLRAPFGDAILRTLMRSSLVLRSPLGFAGVFADPSFVMGEFHEWFIAPLVRSKEAALGQTKLLKSVGPGLVDALPAIHGRITAPVELIWGDADPFFPIEKARAMMKEFAGPVTMKVIPGAKLFSHEDHPAEFAAHAEAFLRARLTS